ncbi:MAG TPA: NAD-dependent epimerase/dehydratase family protein [Gemmatimonadaceae bacterium]|nr:NAD-dependent epimerase/dehydratase family protein [Gemmatimonadaceae bacterium]
MMTPRKARTFQVQPLIKNRTARRLIKASADYLIAAGALIAAIALRYDGSLPAALSAQVIPAVLAIALLKVIIVLLVGDYVRIWRYSSLSEAVVLGAATFVSAGILVVARLAHVSPISLSIVAVDAALTLLGMGALRFTRRVQYWRARSASLPDSQSKRTLILGAGDAADSLLSDLARQPEVNWNVVGLLDDDPNKMGERLRGYPVLGPTTALEQMIYRHNVEHIVIAMPRAEKTTLRSLITRAQSSGASVQAIPTFERLLSGSRGEKRFVTLRDLQDAAEVKRSLLSQVIRDRAESDKVVLVTGGAGYIGVHVVRKLLNRGFRVRVLDNFTYGDESLSSTRSHPRFEMRVGDISSVRDVVSAVKDVDAVIALAAIVGDPACGLNAEETLNLNYESTKILAEACNFYGVERLVFASSCSVYGAAQDDLLTEQSALNPVSLYARTRILSEDVLRERCGDTIPVILRLATVFGLSPRMRFDLVVNTLTVRALVDRHIQIYGGDQWRPFVHCQDVAEAFVLAALAPSMLIRGEVFNVGTTAMNYTLEDVGNIVARVVGPDVQVDTGEFNEDRRNYRVAFEKIERALGFKAEYSLEAGILEMVQAIQESSNLRDYQQARFSNLKHLQDRFNNTPVHGLRISGSPAIIRS